MTPAEIAKSLTPAQRKALLSMRVDVWVERRRVARELKVLKPLLLKGAVRYRPNKKASGLHEVCLTFFGAVVKAELMKMTVVR